MQSSYIVQRPCHGVAVQNPPSIMSKVQVIDNIRLDGLVLL